MAFGCLDHELLIVKLNAYGFSLPALRLIYDYLTHGKQRKRVNNSYSEWLTVMFGVPQGSISGQLLFNIFQQICLLHIVILILQTLQIIMRHIFSISVQMPITANFFVSTSQDISLNVNNFKIKSSDCEKLLGVKLDLKLRFDPHNFYFVRTQ